MKKWYPIFIGLVTIAFDASAQDHLIPDADVLVDPDSYRLKVRHVFDEAFASGVTVRAVVLPSFKDEYAVGLRITAEGAEAFVLEPSSRIWNSELLGMYEAGKIAELGDDGKTIPLEEIRSYRELKERTPADYRDIKVRRRARPLPKDVASKIESLWGKMLLGVRHPDRPILGKDGVTYHFSAWIRGRGDLSGHVWSPEPGTKPGQLAALSVVLADYSRGDADPKLLSEQLEKAMKP